MGLFDGLFGGGPGAEAREKAKMYGELADKLEGKMNEIITERDLAASELEKLYTKFMSNEDSAEGMMITMFHTHTVNWQRDYEMILNSMEAGIAGLKGQIGRAKSLQAIWLTRAAIEEAKAVGGF